MFIETKSIGKPGQGVKKISSNETTTFLLYEQVGKQTTIPVIGTNNDCEIRINNTGINYDSNIISFVASDPNNVTISIQQAGFNIASKSGASPQTISLFKRGSGLLTFSVASFGGDPRTQRINAVFAIPTSIIVSYPGIDPGVQPSTSSITIL